MALFDRLGPIIIELLEQFDDALIALDYDAPSFVPAEPTGVPIVVDQMARS